MIAASTTTIWAAWANPQVAVNSVIKPPTNSPTQVAVDVAVLSRSDAPIRNEVAQSLRAQQGVNIRLHRVTGAPTKGEPHRIATIARARNSAVKKASSPWLMFVDDDVVLAPDCVARLHHVLASRPNYAAVAADYLGESFGRRSSPHVAMGATMFRRSALEKTTFRWEPSKCECLCCCEDIRQTGSRIEYLSTAKAWHLTNPQEQTKQQQDKCGRPIVNTKTADPELARKAKVLVAFNRRDVRRFRNVFLRGLRTSGNHQEVIVVGYGLYPTERRLLSRSTGVRVIHKTVNGQMPPVRRLRDFAEITAAMDPSTPVAYWDASDVIVQGSLDPLWQITKQNPTKILGVREPLGYPHNAAIVGWTHSIENPSMRRRAFELFSTHPFLNSGFSAGTAAAMNQYFVEATRLRESAELRGTTDWGDQTAFNLYCHSDNDRWLEVPECWNYCVHDRPVGEVHVTADGQVVNRSGVPIYVVHGNARSLAKMAIISN